MQFVRDNQAKKELSRLLDDLESLGGPIAILRKGRPVALMLAVPPKAWDDLNQGQAGSG